MEMDIIVTFRHMEHSDALEAYAKDKVGRLSKYLESILDAHVILSVEKNRHAAEVTMHAASGITINGQETREDMYSAIDLVVEKMERQVKKYKDKILGKRPLHKISAKAAKASIISPESLEESRGPRIIKVEDYTVKPMTLEEAAMQIDLLHNDFLVFTNAGTEKVNVIYKRKDGNYGLIEPVV
jgi:putative sigma-54 modulation protein